MRTLLTTIFIIACCESTVCAEIAVIANKSVPTDTLSQRELLDIYTGEIRSWKDGQRIVPHDMTEEGKVREDFYRYLGRKSSRVKSIWVKNLLMGEGSPPEAVKSEAEVVSKVASTPGAIGFVREEMADDSVKVLALIPESDDSP